MNVEVRFSFVVVDFSFNHHSTSQYSTRSIYTK